MLHSCLCVGFWIVVIGSISYRLTLIFQVGVKNLQKLHQIPCSNCAYFTGDYRLKCPLHPMTALSEDAIACRDFQSGCDCTFSNWQHTKTKNPPNSPAQLNH